MSGSIVRFSFAEAALKDRDLNDQNFVFDSSENDPNFTNFWETLLPTAIFFFVNSLIFRLTEQFEVVCLSEI